MPMNENSKQNDIVTEILDAAFDKPWAENVIFVL